MFSETGKKAGSPISRQVGRFYICRHIGRSSYTSRQVKDSTCRQADRSVYLKIGRWKIYLQTGKSKLMYADR